MQDDGLRLPPTAEIPPTCSTIAEVRDAICTIEHLDLRAAEIDQIKELMFPLWKGQRMVGVIMQKDTILYRLRLVDRPPQSLDQIGPPPPNLVTTLQRCNRAGQSLFYCSGARNAPFFELHAEVGQCFVLSTWRTSRRLLLQRAGFSPAIFAALKSNRTCPEPPEMANFSERDRLVYEYISEKFAANVPMDSECLYKLTIAVAEKFIHGGNYTFDGLLYPTIAMWANTDNVALTPNCFAQSLVFNRAEFLRVIKIEGMKMSFDIHDFAREASSDGAILWKGRAPHWTLAKQGDQLLLSVENGSWVARDLQGRVIEPD